MGEAECWGTALFFLQNEPPTPFIQVVAESDIACGLEAGGGVECWTCIGAPECGPPQGAYTALSAGSAGMCALAIDGSAVCFPATQEMTDLALTLPPGVAIEGEDGTVCVLPAIPSQPACVTADPDLAVRMPPPGLELIDVSLGIRHGCGLDPQGMASCWGETSDETPYPQPPSPGPFIEIESSEGWDCALDPAGYASCWSEPGWFPGVSFDPPVVPFVHLTVGGRHACGLTGGGDIHCWGLDIDGSTVVPP